MPEALYRKYRPNTFDDVVGQEHIERTLKNAIEQEKVSHAYLFCGPRGTGKTTMARILAKALLCEKGPTIEPDGTCEDCLEIAAGTHPDVYELDAASRTGVENVREEIINRVHYAPTRGSHKIYIIDEVHMLSTAAFNALLKTLEEPPSHVVFILCTTDPQKVPDTIHSRCQRFDFHRLSVDEIVTRLGAVCVQEDVEFEAEALELIAHQAEGGMRNALTSLEQLAAFGEGRVTLDGAHRILGSLDNEDLSEIVQALGKRDAATCFTWVSDYVETGADIAQFVQDLAEHFRNLYLMSLADADVEIAVSSSTRASMEQELELFGTERLSRALAVLGELMKELRATTNSRLTFEIALTRLLRPESDLTIEALSERLEELEMRVLAMPAAATQVAAQPQPMPQSVPAPQPVPAPQSVPAPQPAPAAQTAAVPQTAPAQPAAAPQQAVQQPAAPQVAQQPAATQAAPAAQPAPATQTSVPAPVQQVAPTAPAAAAAPAALDYNDAAALQRMWSAVTASLRKSNPARGVLFMGAKIEPNPREGGVNIVFSPDSSFAYSAAQKKEVKDLLAQTFVSIAGGTVPFQIVLGNDRGRAQAPVQTQPVQASAPAAAPDPVAQPDPQAAPVQSQPVAAQQAQTPPVQASAPAQPQPPASAQPQPVASAPATPRYEDESPFRDDDPQPQPASNAAPSLQVPSATSAPQPAAPAQAANGQAPAASAPAQASTGQAPVVSAPAPSPTGQAPAASVPPAAVEQTASVASAAADQAAPTDQPSEEDQIKQILTGAFGDGVKFDTM